MENTITITNFGAAQPLTAKEFLMATGHASPTMWIKVLTTLGYTVEIGYTASHILVKRDNNPLLSIHFKATKSLVYFRKAGEPLAEGLETYRARKNQLAAMIPNRQLAFRLMAAIQ